MEIILSEKESINLYENFLKKAFLVILNRRISITNKSLNIIDSQVNNIKYKNKISFSPMKTYQQILKSKNFSKKKIK